MNIKEFNTKISQVEDLTWFNSISEEINFNYLQQNLEFKTVSSLFEFVYHQFEGWAKLGVNFKNEFNKIYFKHKISTIFKIFHKDYI